ncbi:LTA synthase family protein [Sediminibacterium roseum]|uniref:LTA synthase family protein n=1 Tax=Sediminibacterium roseum TaxID=1978412 RepID=A0ABW9ZML2_9BACT|nr:LTA synthase family protein [Sediminibacterium roseum]NCI48310.1 LTA synthase family protein [Sediminibacterium roseum]
MPDQKNSFVLPFVRIAFALLITVCLMRVFEYIVVASKSFTPHAWQFEVAGLFYDIWLWFIYSGVAFVVCWLVSKIKTRAGIVLFHVLNVMFIVSCLALLITFSQRNNPFDHELFTRNAGDTIETIKQMAGAGIKPYLSFFVYIPLYFVVSARVTKKISAGRKYLSVLAGLSVLSVVLIRYANPSPDWFSQNGAYYLTANKFTYWVEDSYDYFRNKNASEKVLTDEALKKEVAFYQANQPFHFTSTSYPLLHSNDEKDVLGGFFNFQQTPPNIVLLVVEGLSRDFSGDHAFAGSFTPFLDSLSHNSLTWDNFLSTAPGTFAAHPAIEGSLPYGKRGFSVMNVMPEHLSLTKILKANGYHTKFLVGFNTDFDNMGGFIRLQGTDFTLTQYPSKYKEMGIGKEGWSMGYPDDALYSRAFEVMDSLPKTPYFNIFHTGTTHMPYLFEQKPQYEKKFDEKLKTMNVSSSIKKTLRQTKEVLVTFMFSDDCLRKFFSDYRKRADYSNTIFLITGDHHIGSFPTINEMDDYHVPFMIYSPMLKRSQKFLSVNTHNNITPTILALLNDNFKLNNYPKEVHWLSGVIDTATAFRNKQSMPFMWWDREIGDYIYKEYFLSDNQLYRINPDLTQVKYRNDTLKKHIIALRENFKKINGYVCENNRIYPAEKELLPGKKELVFDYNDTSTHYLFTHRTDTMLMPMYKLPKGYRYLFVEFTAGVNIADPNPENYPSLRFSMIDTKNRGMNFLNWTKRNMETLTKGDFVPRQWNEVTATDLFTMDDYKKVKDLWFDLGLYNGPIVTDLRIRNIRLKIFGIK